MTRKVANGKAAKDEVVLEGRKFVEPGGIPGLRRFNKRVVQRIEDGEAPHGDYVALQVIGIPNPKWDPTKKDDEKSFEERQERPCVYLHPRDIVNCPTLLSPTTAWELKQKGLIREVSQADYDAHDAEESVAYQKASFGESATDLSG